MPPVIEFPLDTTGTSIDNKVTGEQHTLPDRIVRAFAPLAGAFFADSVVVKDTDTNTPLTALQYYVSERLEMPTAQAKKDVCLVIVITDPMVSNHVSIDYQAIGGIYDSVNGQAVVDQFYAMPDVERPTTWKEILRRKEDWDATDLRNETGQAQGFESVTRALQRIDTAIARGDEKSHTFLREHAINEVERLGSNTELAMQNLMESHRNETDPHPQYIKTTEIEGVLQLVRRPINAAPIDGAIDITYSSVTLNASAYRSMYDQAQIAAQFQVSKQSDFAGQVVIDQVINSAGTSLVLTNQLVAATRYYWRVRYQSAEGIWSGWSIGTTFLTKATYVQAPTMTAPISGVIIPSDNPTLTTNAFVAVGQSDTHAATDWEIWDGPNGTGIRVYSSVNNTTNKTSIQVTAGVLAVDKAYYARARYTGAALGLSDWSPDVVIRTPKTFLPTQFGSPLLGGFYGGTITYNSKTYVIIVAPKASGEASKQLQTVTSQISGAYSTTDSVANTTALIPNGVAAPWARALSIGGFTDWQIPAKDVLAKLYDNLRPNLSTIAAAFKTGGAEAFHASSQYWSSTCYDWVRDDSYTSGGDPIYQTVTDYNPHGTWIDVEPDCSDTPGSWGPTDVHSHGTPGSTDYLISWNCPTTEQIIVGYTPEEEVEIHTQLWEAYAATFGTTSSVLPKAKNLPALARAVRLVDIATLTAETVPTVLGTMYAGGYYAGQILVGTELFALVVSPKASGYNGNIGYAVADADYENLPSNSRCDGWNNTISRNTARFPANQWARSLNIAGYTDWYIPSTDELEMLFRAFRPLPAEGATDNYTTNDEGGNGINPSSVPSNKGYVSTMPGQSAIAAFRSPASEHFGSFLYVSSSTAKASYQSSAIRSSAQYFNTGQQVMMSASALGNKARAVRRVKIGDVPANLTVPGTIAQGGVVAGVIKDGADNYAIIVSSRELGERDVQAYNLKVIEADSTDVSMTNRINGLANTNAMKTRDSVGYPLATWARNANIAGYTDWYIPALDELELAYRNLKPYITSSSPNSIGNNELMVQNGVNSNSVPAGAAYTATVPEQTTSKLMLPGAHESFIIDPYWTSTALTVPAGSSSSMTRGFTVVNMGSGRQSFSPQGVIGRVRLFRRVKL